LRLRSIFRRSRVERELDEELRFHLGLAPMRSIGPEFQHLRNEKWGGQS